MSVDDIIVVPLFDGKFQVFRIIQAAQPISQLPDGTCPFISKTGTDITTGTDGLLHRSTGNIDIGFFIEIVALTSPLERYSYADQPLTSRMKMRQTNGNITDVAKSVDRAISHKSLNFYAETSEKMTQGLIDTICAQLDDEKFEKIINWYFRKMGADVVKIPAKNEAGKEDGADADIVATVEPLKTIYYIQAKKHSGITDSWALEQITRYKEQKASENDGYTVATWVISTCSKYSDSAIQRAREYGVRLLAGIDFARLLVDSGIGNIDDAFA